MPAEVQITASLWEFFTSLVGLIAIVQGLTLFVIRSITRDEIAKSTGTYVPLRECEKVQLLERQQHEDIVRRLERLEGSSD